MKYLLVLLVAQVLLILTGFIVMGWAVLGLPIGLGLPAGNLLAWTGMMTISGLVLTGSRPRSWSRMAGWVILGLAVAWMPFSLVIFDNPAFSGTTSFWWAVWVRYSLAMIVLPIGLLLINGVMRLRSRWLMRRNQASDNRD